MYGLQKAVLAAKAYIAELFDAEGATNIGLEEVEKDEMNGEWKITIGFSRPWDSRPNTFASMMNASIPKRDYKVVRLSLSDNEIRSVKNRETST